MEFRFESFALDTGRRQLLRAGAAVHLSPKAFELLRLLLENRPIAVSKADLHARVWPETFVTDTSLATLVNEIRSALEDNPRRARFVRTVHGYGYAFCGNATAINAATGPEAAIWWVKCEERDFALAEGEHILGRGAGTAVRVDFPEVSRRHARITISGAGATLEDLGSRNGTFLHGERVTAPRPLEDGDEIRLGGVSMTFHAASDGGTTRAVSTGDSKP